MKQICMTHLIIENEFIAFAATDKEVEWLRNLLFDIEL